jgi:hypothetical protein
VYLVRKSMRRNDNAFNGKNAVSVGINVLQPKPAILASFNIFKKSLGRCFTHINYITRYAQDVKGAY